MRLRHVLILSPLAVALACTPARRFDLLDRHQAAPTADPVAEREPVGQVFWVVDGRTLGIDSTGAISARMQRLGADSILSFEVLKGKAAIARFGVQASGGAVIVRTKSGNSGLE